MPISRIASAAVGVCLVSVAACGDEPRKGVDARTTASAHATVAAARSAPTTPPPPRSGAVTVSHDPRGTGQFRAGGRSWRACGTTVYVGGDDLYGIAASGPVGCAAATDVFRALAEQVLQHERAGEDCFPGYCNPNARRPTTVARYRCRATDHGDVSVSLSIVCRRGDRVVSAGAADDE